MFKNVFFKIGSPFCVKIGGPGGVPGGPGRGAARGGARQSGSRRPVRDQEQAVIGAPDQEGPVGSVPEPDQQEDRHEIAVRTQLPVV